MSDRLPLPSPNIVQAYYMEKKQKADRMQNYASAHYEQPSTLSSEIDKPVKQKPYFFAKSFLELRSKKYGREGDNLPDQNLSSQSRKVTGSSRKLSTEYIVRLAAERYIQFCSNNPECTTTFIHPQGSALSSLSTEERRGADLAHLLLAIADNVGNNNFDSARRLLTHCECEASESGNPIERLTLYFSKALHERIDRETGNSKMNSESDNVRGENGLSTGVNLPVLATHGYIPFTKVLQFTSMEAILEHVSMETKIHLIDLQIRSGIQWIVLIQALSERKSNPIEFLQITAVDTKDRHKVEDVGKRLESYANSLNIPFSFEVVFVSDMNALDEILFDIRSGEAVVIYASTILRTLISKPDILKNLMGVIEDIEPLIMIVVEVEASDNSPSFVNRFVEAFFFYSAWFDCLEDCMDRDNEYRTNLERDHLGKGIVNTVATEGEERITRSVKIDVWRSFFSMFKMVEVELPKSSFNQADMVLKQLFSCGSSCTIDTNDKRLIVRWKGVPMFSLSTWKFK